MTNYNLTRKDIASILEGNVLVLEDGNTLTFEREI